MVTQGELTRRQHLLGADHTPRLGSSSTPDSASAARSKGGHAAITLDAILGAGRPDSAHLAVPPPSRSARRSGEAV